MSSRRPTLSSTVRTVSQITKTKPSKAKSIPSEAVLPVIPKKTIKKIVLAYSGGLDTSVILKWLQDQYQCEVVTFTADIGQGEELSPAKAKAKAMGIPERNIHIRDLKEEFVRDFVFPMFRANALYEGEYLLGTSIARPLIAKHLVEIARVTGADAIAHGATGKGNDQVRFELGAYALQPDIQVVAPWREWDLLSRPRLLEYAQKHHIPVDFKKKRGEAPYSMDANLLHISYEGGVLEDPDNTPPESMWRLTKPLSKTPANPTRVTLQFARGDVVAINGSPLSPAEVLTRLNKLGGEHGIGRLDLVENRYIGMKSRGCYETPGGSILWKAHRAMESLTLDREVIALKDDLMPRYARLIYNGYWFSPERLLLQGLIDQSQRHVNGEVRLQLHKGGVQVLGRRSDKDSLFDKAISTFDEDGGAYNQADAEGFIRLNALRLRTGSRRAGKKNPYL